MKRNYIRPICKIFKINMSNILVLSNTAYSSTHNIIEEIERKRRMEYMISSGANKTQYEIDKKDIFVYNRQCINNKIIKRTANPPKIGSVIQLDSNPRVGIFKHLQDDEYDYWYCKYLPNDGEDIEVTY